MFDGARRTRLCQKPFQKVRTMRYQQMNYTADRVEAVLRSRRAPARVVGGRSLPRYLELFVRPEGATKVSQIRSLAADIALAIGVGAVRIDQSGDLLTVQIAQEAQRPDVSLSRLMSRMPEVPPHTAVLGLSTDGAPLMLRLSAPDVGHVLIAGTTGCGKTQLAHSVLWSLVQRNRPRDLGLIVIDPKRRDGGWYAKHLGSHLLAPVADTCEAAKAALARLCLVLDKRSVSRDPLPRCVVFVDELADLVVTGGESVLGALTRIAQRGREHGVHLVCCTQKPSSAAIGSLLRSNLPVRLVGRVTSSDDARVATGRSGTGAEKLMGRGDFLAITAMDVIRFQAALPA